MQEFEPLTLLLYHRQNSSKVPVLDISSSPQTRNLQILWSQATARIIDVT
jgi:hypothetical protein